MANFRRSVRALDRSEAARIQGLTILEMLEQSRVFPPVWHICALLKDARPCELDSALLTAVGAGLSLSSLRLLGLGASPNARESSGLYRSALLRAAQARSVDCLENLLNENADATAEDSAGRNVVEFCAARGRAECLRMLLKRNKGLIHARNDGGNDMLLSAVSGRHADVVSVLLYYGVSPNARNEAGLSAVHIACLGNDAPILRLLLVHDALIEKRTNEGWTAAHVAAHSNSPACLEMLLRQRASMGLLTTRHGSTILHLAAAGGHYKAACLALSLSLSGKALLHCRDAEGRTPLHLAGKGGCTDVARLLLSRNANPNARDCHGRSALHACIAEGHIVCAEMLESHGASVFLADELGFTPLHLAAEYGHRNCCQQLLEWGAEVNAQTKQHHTPLHLALINKHCLTAERLVMFGASPNMKDDRGVSPLHLGAEKGDLHIIILLLSSGGDMNIRDIAGQGILHYCARGNDIDNLKYLSQLSRSLDDRDMKGRNALYEAAVANKPESVRYLLKFGADVSGAADAIPICSKKGYLECLKLLIDKGADVNQEDENGLTPLHLATMNDHPHVVELLLQARADITATNDILGKTPIHLAAEKGLIRCLKLLLWPPSQAGFKKFDCTPLFLAAINNRKEAVEVLLDAGTKSCFQETSAIANSLPAAEKFASTCFYSILQVLANEEVRLKGSWQSALMKACEGAAVWRCRGPDRETSELMTRLMSYGAREWRQTWGEALPSQTTLHAVAAEGRVDVLCLLLAAGLDPKVVDESGETALHAAVRFGSSSCTEVLLAAGVDVDPRNNRGQTPLLLAVRSNSSSVETLLAYGADINVRESSKLHTPLHVAARSGASFAVSQLLDCGADKEAIDASGSTPLHYAVLAGKNAPKCVTILILAGASITVRDNEGRTVLHICVERWRPAALDACISKAPVAELQSALCITDKQWQTPLQLARNLGHHDCEFLLLHALTGNRAKQYLLVRQAPQKPRALLGRRCRSLSPPRNHRPSPSASMYTPRHSSDHYEVETTQEKPEWSSSEPGRYQISSVAETAYSVSPPTTPVPGLIYYHDHQRRPTSWTEFLKNLAPSCMINSKSQYATEVERELKVPECESCLTLQDQTIPTISLWEFLKNLALKHRSENKGEQMRLSPKRDPQAGPSHSSWIDLIKEVDLEPYLSHSRYRNWVGPSTVEELSDAPVMPTGLQETQSFSGQAVSPWKESLKEVFNRSCDSSQETKQEENKANPAKHIAQESPSANIRSPPPISLVNSPMLQPSGPSPISSYPPINELAEGAYNLPSTSAESHPEPPPSPATTSLASPPSNPHSFQFSFPLNNITTSTPSVSFTSTDPSPASNPQSNKNECFPNCGTDHEICELTKSLGAQTLSSLSNPSSLLSHPGQSLPVEPPSPIGPSSQTEPPSSPIEPTSSVEQISPIEPSSRAVPSSGAALSSTLLSYSAMMSPFASTSPMKLHAAATLSSATSNNITTSTPSVSFTSTDPSPASNPQSNKNECFPNCGTDHEICELTKSLSAQTLSSLSNPSSLLSHPGQSLPVEPPSPIGPSSQTEPPSSPIEPTSSVEQISPIEPSSRAVPSSGAALSSTLLSYSAMMSPLASTSPMKLHTAATLSFATSNNITTSTPSVSFTSTDPSPASNPQSNKNECFPNCGTDHEICELTKSLSAQTLSSLSNPSSLLSHPGQSLPVEPPSPIGPSSQTEPPSSPIEPTSSVEQISPIEPSSRAVPSSGAALSSTLLSYSAMMSPFASTSPMKLHTAATLSSAKSSSSGITSHFVTASPGRNSSVSASSSTSSSSVKMSNSSKVSSFPWASTSGLASFPASLPSSVIMTPATLVTSSTAVPSCVINQTSAVAPSHMPAVFFAPMPSSRVSPQTHFMSPYFPGCVPTPNDYSPMAPLNLQDSFVSLSPPGMPAAPGDPLSSATVSSAEAPSSTQVSFSTAQPSQTAASLRTAVPSSTSVAASSNVFSPKAILHSSTGSSSPVRFRLRSRSLDESDKHGHAISFVVLPPDQLTLPTPPHQRHHHLCEFHRKTSLNHLAKHPSVSPASSVASDDGSEYDPNCQDCQKLIQGLSYEKKD